jgi:hypothetical protein
MLLVWITRTLAAWTVVFIAIALWLFGREEFQKISIAAILQSVEAACTSESLTPK